MNTWMNAPQYLAQVGHFFGAFSVALLAAFLSVCFGRGRAPFDVVCIAIVFAAAIKEFWYDLRYELPRQSFGDSGMDFGFYLLGTVAAAGVVAYCERYGHLEW